MTDAILISLRAAGCATALAIPLGLAVAYVLARRRFPGRSLVEGISLLPLVLPPTVMGYYLLVLFGGESALGGYYRQFTGRDLVFTFNGIVVAACVGSLPLLIRQAQVAFAEVDPEAEDSARAFGASEWTVFFHITLPLARRGLVAGTVLAFARALGDFGATLMVGGNLPGETRTLSLAVYDAWQAGDNATAHGLSLLLAAIALAVSVTASHLTAER